MFTVQVLTPVSSVSSVVESFELSTTDCQLSTVDCRLHHEYRNITCVNRMKPPCETIVPKAELPWVVFIWLPRS